MKLVKTTYSTDDVEILLKDISGCMQALDTAEREKLIQSGVHYSEMLPLEYKPTDKYMEIYNNSLVEMSHKTALGIAVLSERLYRMHKGNFVIISIARAGIPVGILIKRYIKLKKNIDLPHYGISIIRGKGIDENAMEYIYSQHSDIGVDKFQFIDGWTGKGAINNQLKDAVLSLKQKDTKWLGLSGELGVLADPANITSLCGTHSDFLIPSACLNSTVSGLVSRTILNESYINVSDGDFHGAVYFEDLEKEDKSLEFIDTVTNQFSTIADSEIILGLNDTEVLYGITGIEVVNQLAEEYGIQDINLIKPGVGETTRVLLRRLPWKVLIDTETTDKDKEGLEHIIRLCEEKHIPIEEHKLGSYKACGIIKDLSADA